MKISQKRQLDRFKRSLDFVDKQAKDFAASSQALKARDRLKDVIARAEATPAEGATVKPGRRPYNSEKLRALNALRGELDRFSKTAMLIKNMDESFDNSFQMPDKRRKNELVKAARHYIAEFPKVSDKFKDFEMDSSDLDKLKNALDTYENIQTVPAEKPERKPRTPAAPNPIIGEGIDLVEALDIIMGNKYEKDSKQYAAWKEAETLEVTRRKRKNKNADA